MMLRVRFFFLSRDQWRHNRKAPNSIPFVGIRHQQFKTAFVKQGWTVYLWRMMLVILRVEKIKKLSDK